MWTLLMATPKADIKKKISFYEKQRNQRELDEFLEVKDEISES